MLQGTTAGCCLRVLYACCVDAGLGAGMLLLVRPVRSGAAAVCALWAWPALLQAAATRCCCQRVQSKCCVGLGAGAAAGCRCWVSLQDWSLLRAGSRTCAGASARCRCVVAAKTVVCYLGSMLV